jgi:multiple sugar transport system permease protein
VNTLAVVATVVHVELILGLAIALLFAAGVPWKPLLLALVLAPYAVSEVGAVVMWRFMLDPDIGIVTRALAAFGLPPIEWSVKPWHGLGVVALISIWLHLPFTFVILYAARLALPVELYEAARVDGAGPWQQFRLVTLPLMMPAILVAMLFRYIFAFRLFSEVWLVTQGGPARSTEVLAVYLYLEAFRYNQFGIATATGWIMVLTSLLVGLIYLRRLYREMFAHAA